MLDDATLLLPDRPGNNRVDSYGNIVPIPASACCSSCPKRQWTLRVNGTARVITDAAGLRPSPRTASRRSAGC